MSAPRENNTSPVPESVTRRMGESDGEEAGTYRIIVGFHNTLSPDGRAVVPAALDEIIELPFPSLAACMSVANELRERFRERNDFLGMRLLTPVDIRAEEERQRKAARRLSRTGWQEPVVTIDPAKATRQIFIESGGLAFDSQALVRANGIDRSSISADAGALRVRNEYEGVDDIYDLDYDDVQVQRVCDALWCKGSAVGTLIYGPLEKRVPDRPNFHIRAPMKPGSLNHHR